MTSAIEGLERLARAVGSGEIEASVTVNQPYAQRQHEELGWKHPRGGRAKYLGGPLIEESAKLVQIAADHLISGDGTDLEHGMVRIAEEMSQMVEENAPSLYDVLRYSSQPEVVDNGVVKYSRAPKVARQDTK